MCESEAMSEAPPSLRSAPPPPDLPGRLEALGRRLGGREAGHRAALAGARALVEQLHARVAVALERFHRVAAEAGAPHLPVEQSAVRIDDKHLRAVEFELSRGRHRAVVTARSRGELTLVGPFHSGKAEGPCLSFPFDAGAEIDAALADFLERFLEEAAAP